MRSTKVENELERLEDVEVLFSSEKSKLFNSLMERMWFKIAGVKKVTVEDLEEGDES